MKEIVTISSHLDITSKKPENHEQVLVAFVVFDVEIKVFYESFRIEALFVNSLFEVLHLVECLQSAACVVVEE